MTSDAGNQGTRRWSLVITLTVPINYEVISWILAYRSAAEVLEPQSLRDIVEKELRETLTTCRNMIKAGKRRLPEKRRLCN